MRVLRCAWAVAGLLALNGGTAAAQDHKESADRALQRARGSRELFTALRREMALALEAASPRDRTEAEVRARYRRLFAEAPEVVESLHAASKSKGLHVHVPTGRNGVAERTLGASALAKWQWRDARPPSGSGASAARGAFDPFAGHWHGWWRQADDSGEERAVFSEHQWGEVEPHPQVPGVYVQEVVLAARSRHEEVPLKARVAINALNVRTGRIAGAVGVRRDDSSGQLVAARPHVGLHVETGRLLWLAHEGQRDGGPAYSVFLEAVEETPQERRYTILGFDVVWDPARDVPVEPVRTKGGRYLAATEGEEQPPDHVERAFSSTRFRYPVK